MKLTRGIVLALPSGVALGAGSAVTASPGFLDLPTTTVLALLAAAGFAATTLVAWLRSRRESSYRTIVGNLGPRIGAGLLTSEGVIVEASGLPWGASAGQIAGLVGRALWEAEIFCGDTQAKARLQQAIAAAARGEPVNCDVQARLASGETRTVEVSLRPLRRNRQRVEKLIVSLFDATERQTAEAALATQLQARERLFDNSPLAFIEWDADLRVRRWSRCAEELFGWTRSEALGHSSTELGMVALHHVDAEHKSPLMLDAMLLTMRRYRRKDGVEFWLETYNSVLRGADGAVIAIQTLSRDVTEKRKLLTCALENESRFRNIFHQAAVGIALLDRKGRWLTVNRHFCDISGYSEAELLAMDLKTLTHPDDVSAGAELAEQIIAGQIDDYRIEKRLIGKDGTVLSALLHMRRIDATPEAPMYLVAVIEDIGEHKADREQAARRIDSLEAKVEARSEQLQQMMNFAQRRATDIALVTEMIGLLPAARDLNEAGSVVERYLPQLFPQAYGALYFEGADAGRFMLHGQWGRSAAFAPMFTIADCWATRRGHEHRVEEPLDPMRCPHLTEESRDHSYSCLPVIALGSPAGVIELHWGSCADGITPDSVLLRSIAEQIGLAIGNMRLRDELGRQAFYDPLTGLYSRRTIDDFLRRRHADWKRNSHSYSLLMVDLDNFKSINDRFGHDAGDQVLREIAALLRRTVRTNEAVFRFSGDEFLLITDTAAPEEAMRCAERVRREIENFRISGNGRILPSITASIGVASCPVDGDNPPDLLQCTDEALLAAKAGGRNRACRFRLHIGTGVAPVQSP